MNNANIENLNELNKHEIELRNKGIGVFVFSDYIFGGVCVAILLFMMIKLF